MENLEAIKTSNQVGLQLTTMFVLHASLVTLRDRPKHWQVAEIPHEPEATWEYLVVV